MYVREHMIYTVYSDCMLEFASAAMISVMQKKKKKNLL